MVYIYSKLTLNFYSLENEIYTIVPVDDSKAEYNAMMLSGNIQEVESLEFEIEEMNMPKVPQLLSRMKFIMQVFITTAIKYEDIVIFITALPIESLDDVSKYLVLTRLRSATHFDRNSSDLLTISQMMGITQLQLDSIFINGNLIE